MSLKVFSRFLILAALLAPAVRAESPTWTARFDVDLGVIHDVAAGGGVAYAATFNGVFRSEDGRRWEEAGLQGRGIGLVVVDAAGKSVFAVEFSGSLWVSLDGGEHWKASDPGAPVSVLAVDPGEPNTVWAGSYLDGALWTSEDRGEHWARIEIETDGYGIHQLLFDSVDGTLYAQATDSSFYSKPAGAAWQRVRPLGVWMDSIVAGVSAPGVLLAATDRGFCASSDHGATWSCSQGLGPTGGRLAVVPGEGSLPPRLLWASGAMLQTSDDGGNTWRAVSPTGPYPPFVTSLAVDETSGRIFAGSVNLALRSDDRGESWDHVVAGLRAAWIESLAAGPGALWAGSGTAFESLITSTDQGHSWSLETIPSQPVAISDIIVDPITSAVYAGGEYSLFRKAPGEGWTRSGLLPSYLFALAADPSTPQRLWLGSSDGVRYSDNGGSTWTGTSLAQAVYALVVDPRRPTRIHAGGDYEYSGYWSYPSGGAIFTSNDSGQTWAKSSDVGSAVQSIALDPFSERIYAGTRLNGVVTSFDGGVTWRSPSSSPEGELRVLVADPTRPDTLYASTSQGVHRSRDFGRSWLPFGEGLPRLDVRSLAVSTDGRFLHAGTAGLGVFDLALEDEPVAGFPCVPGPSRLCLLGNRFQVELIAQPKGGGEPENGEAHSLGDRAGYFGIPAFTGDGAAPEVVVKMLPDGAFGVDGSPILYSSMTGAAFALRVTDTVEGIETAYRSDSSRPFCGGADLISIDAAGSERKAATIPAPVAQGLSLLGGRFTVSLEARTRSGRVAAGVPFASGDRYGFFSLPGITGDPGLPEVVVKMLDGRGFNDAFWVFRGSLTGLDYTLTVHDEQTGNTRTYESDVPFCGGADIDAFPE